MRSAERFQRVSAILLLGLAGCGSPPMDLASVRAEVEGMNLLVVVFDAAAANHFSFLGYDRETTPNLTALASESVVFENAYAQASATPLSVVSLLTGAYPVGVELPNFKGEIVPAIHADRPTLASALSTSHPVRAAFSANRWVCRELGYGRGFQTLHELWNDKAGNKIRDVVSAEQLNERLLEFLRSETSGPFFAYAHYLEPHLPYMPPEPYASMFDPEARGIVQCTAEGLRPYRASRPPKSVRQNVIGLYDGNLAYADAQFGKIVQELKGDGRWDRTILVFLSDHGEAFWQHNWRGHGSKVYEEFVRVPVLLRIPGLSGRRVMDVVELVDIFPTLLDLFGLEAPEGALAGQSWLPKLFTDTPADPQEQVAFFRNHERRMISGLRWENYKAVRKESQVEAVELYDLSRDPREEINLQSHRDPAAREATLELSRRLAARLSHILENGVDTPLAQGGADSLSIEAMDQLRALGYFN